MTYPFLRHAVHVVLKREEIHSLCIPCVFEDMFFLFNVPKPKEAQQRFFFYWSM